jgi:3-oxoadipate enol-lactonase
MRVKVNGIAFHVEVEGPEGAPWVVFSNSLMTDLSMWDDQATALSKTYRVLRYDQRGHGQTEAPQGAYPFNTLVADVVAIFDALRIARAHFVGLSMGGMTAVALAEQHPDRLLSIVPCDCGPASSPQSAQQWSDRIQIARSEGMEALVEPTVGRWCPPDFLKEQKLRAGKLRGMIRTTPLNGFIGCASALSDFDLRPGLSGIKLPAQFLCGAKDASLGGTKALHAGVAGSKMIEIADAGHISNIEKPAEFTKAVLDFLKSA